MAKDKEVKIVPIEVGSRSGQLSKAILDRERERLIRFYRLKLERGETSRVIKTDKDIIASVTKTMNKAVNGYARAAVKLTPEETLVTRLSFLTRYNKMQEIWEDGVISFPDPDDKVQLNPVEATVGVETEDGDVAFLEIRKKSEAKWLEQRRASYINEFDFNSSSDAVVLESILVDELLLRRLENNKINGAYVNESHINDIQKRMRENLNMLGVSRKQRISDTTANKGSVAQVSNLVEEKLKQVRALGNKDKRDKIIRKILSDYSNINLKDIYNAIEEIEGLRRRSIRPEMETLDPIASMNEIPELVEVNVLLEDDDGGNDASTSNEAG